MPIILCVVVFLLGLIAGILLLGYFGRARDTHRLIETMERVAAERAGQRERLAEERTVHVNATATVLLKELRLTSASILQELQSAARERRALMSLAMGRAPESNGSLHGPASSGRPIGGGDCTLSAEDPTPPSGYRVSELLATTEDRPQ